MLTNINAKQLAVIYNYSEKELHSYLQVYRKELEQLKTKFQYYDGTKLKTRTKQNYSSEALRFIVFEILKDTPEGYEWNGKTLIKLKEQEELNNKN